MLKLRYKKSSKKINEWMLQFGGDPRQWDVLSPQLPGYNYQAGYPTFGIADLQRLNLIPIKEVI